MRAGALSLRDTEWSSWSSLLGWHVRGIWAPNSEGTDIHTVDASRDQTFNNTCATAPGSALCGKPLSKAYIGKPRCVTANRGQVSPAQELRNQVLALPSCPLFSSRV